MAGFCIRVSESGGRPLDPPVVSLGKGEALERYRLGGVEAAWSRWPNSRQLWVRRGSQNLAWIEGQPDRLPREGEDLRHWIHGRWGSFRAFEVNGPENAVTIFLDPLGTRPVAYCRVNGQYLISDKLATLVSAAAPTRLAINWGALFEYLVGGAVINADTTVQLVEQVAAGAVLHVTSERAVLEGVIRLADVDPEIEPPGRRPDYGAALLAALRTSVTEIWTDREAALLLSGGLDSRLVLGLAGAGRRVICVTSQANLESAIARHVAAKLGADFVHVIRPPDQYPMVMKFGDLISGGMYHATSAHFLGLASEWRQAGIGGLCHAYLFDTVLKAWHAVRLERVEDAMTYPADAGERGYRVLSRLGRQTDLRQPDLIRSLLGSDALASLNERLRTVGERFPQRRGGSGTDDALDEWIVTQVSRHIHYIFMLSCIEEHDVSACIFHPAVWRWRMGAPAPARYQARAFLRALRLAGRGLAWIADASYNEPPAIRQLGFLPWGREVWRPLGRRAWHRAEAVGMVPRFSDREHPENDPDQGAWPPFPPLFRAGAGLDLVHEGFDELEKCGAFRAGACHDLLASFLRGNDDVVTTTLALAGAGRWVRRVRELGTGEGAWWIRTERRAA